MIRTLFKSSRQYTKGAIVTIGLSALEVVFEIVIPTAMSWLIDYGINAGDTAMVWRYGGMLILFAAMQLVTGMLAARLAARSSAGFASNLRMDMYQNIQTFSFSNIDKFSTGSIVTRLTTDVTNVQMAYQMMTRMVIRSPLMLIFSMTAAFRIDSGISMIFLVCLPILAVGLVCITRKVLPMFQQVFHTYDELNNVVQENVQAIRVVKTFDQQEHEIQKFGGVSERIYRLFSKAERIMTLNMPLMQSCMYLCMLLISWIGAKAIIQSGNDPALGLTRAA